MSTPEEALRAAEAALEAATAAVKAAELGTPADGVPPAAPAVVEAGSVCLGSIGSPRVKGLDY